MRILCVRRSLKENDRPRKLLFDMCLCLDEPRKAHFSCISRWLASAKTWFERWNYSSSWWRVIFSLFVLSRVSCLRLNWSQRWSEGRLHLSAAGFPCLSSSQWLDLHLRRATRGGLRDSGSLLWLLLLLPIVLEERTRVTQSQNSSGGHNLDYPTGEEDLTKGKMFKNMICTRRGSGKRIIRGNLFKRNKHP